MRKTRAVTPLDTIRLRFGPILEQVRVYSGLFSNIWGGVFLLGLANFISAAFDLPVTSVILFTGVVVIFYSVSGGSWSVMITDNLQALIMVPVCVALAFLSLKAVGGLDGLMSGIQEQGLVADYRLIVEPGHVYTSTAGKVGKGYFTVAWVLASMLYNLIMSVNITQCHRYLSAKTCADAHKAAFFAAGLLFLGMFVWYTPPLVARVLYQEEVEALAAQPAAIEQQTAAAKDISGTSPEAPKPVKPKSRAELKNPAEGAYAIAAKKLLPPGLLGLIMIAMFAAAMSSIDSFLTGTAGVISKNLYPPLARALGKKPWEGKALLRLTKGVNLCLGLWAMFLALYLHQTGGGGEVFEIGLQIVLLIGTPMGLPFTLSFFAKKLPSWGPLVGMGVGLIFSAVFMFGKHWHPVLAEWTGSLLWHHRMYIMVSATLFPTLLTSFFWKGTSQAYKDRVDHFFELLKTPIDFKEEVGESEDHTLLNIVGGLGLIIAALILTLLFFVKGSDNRWAVVFVAGVIGVISSGMYLTGRIKAKQEKGTWGSHKDSTLVE